jgi:hypothetical protein
MKCWKCGNELTTGDAPDSTQCRRCEGTRISSSTASAYGRPEAVSSEEITAGQTHLASAGSQQEWIQSERN